MFVTFFEMINVLSMIATSFAVLAIIYFVMGFMDNSPHPDQSTNNAAAQSYELESAKMVG